MKNPHINSWAGLGLFSLGASYLLYSFMQYFFTPLCWWLAQNFKSFAWMNNIFIFFDYIGLDVFTAKSLTYSLIGILSFFCGYIFTPARLVQSGNTMLLKRWNLRRAEQVFWLLFLAGFSIKLVKVLAGLDIYSAIFVDRGLLSNPYALFFLSLNWFHLVGFMVINVAYQEAKLEKHVATGRLQLIAHGTSIFVILASLAGGSKMAILAPILGLLIIRKFYSNLNIDTKKYMAYIILFAISVLVVTFFISKITSSAGAIESDSTGFIFASFYMLFYRLNMSQIVAAVIEKGQQAYPNGTLGQFWVDMKIYGSDGENVFDGNEFGRAIGAAQPEDTVTGIASTNIGDLFINYDILGIILGMILTGFFYKTLLANCLRRLPFFVLLYALMWPILIHGMESPITVLYSTTIKMISLCIFVHFLISYKIKFA